MDYQQLGIADIGQVGKYLERLHHASSGSVVALQMEGEHRAAAFGQQRLGESITTMRGQFRVCDRFDRRQKFDHLAGVGDVPFHAQAECLDPLQDGERIVRTHHRTEGAQSLAPRVQ